MNTVFNHKYSIVSLPLIVASALLAGFDLIALSTTATASPTPTCTPLPRKACVEWPCKEGSTDCTTIKDNVKKAFLELLNKASDKTPDGKQLRHDLLCPTNNFQLAHEVVKEKLKTIPTPHGGHVSFEEYHLVMFYEPADNFDENGPTFALTNKYPDNRCIHIFALPEEGTVLDPKDLDKHLKRHLKCCYKPW